MTEDFTNNYRRFLQFYLREKKSPYTIEVHRDEVERFHQNIDLYNDSKQLRDFFFTETVDGKTVAIRLEAIQAVHILWEPSSDPVNPTHSDSGIEISLSSREENIVVHTEPEFCDELADFLRNLEEAPESNDAFHGFTDEDEEFIYVNTQELIYIECPTHYVEEGWRIINGEED